MHKQTAVTPAHDAFRLNAAGFEQLPCEGADRIKPASDDDYLDVRRVLNGKVQSIVAHGAPCLPERDASCLAQVKKLEQAPPTQNLCKERFCPEVIYAVATSGSRVEKVETPENLAQKLGVIDTPTEAWLMAMSRSSIGVLSCDLEFSAYRKEDSGFLLRYRWYSKACRPVQIAEELYGVTSSGLVTPRGSNVHTDPDACFSN